MSSTRKPGRPRVATDHALIREMRADGQTYQAVGDAVGVSRERIRQILSIYDANGPRCLDCGAATVHSRYCPTHLALRAEAVARKKAVRKAARAVSRKPAWRAASLCVDCGGIRQEGRVRCEPCRLKSNQYQRDRRKRFLASGFCSRCGRERDEKPLTLCGSCRRVTSGYLRAHRQRQRPGGAP